MWAGHCRCWYRDSGRPLWLLVSVRSVRLPGPGLHWIKHSDRAAGEEMEYLQFHLENFTLLERSNKWKSKLINKTKNKLVLNPIWVLTILLSVERLRHILMWLMIVSRAVSISWESWLFAMSRTGQPWPPTPTHPVSHWTQETITQLPCPHILSVFPQSVHCLQSYPTNPDTVMSIFLSPRLSGDMGPGDRWNLLS